MIEQIILGFSNKLYELGRILLVFGIIGLATWIVTKSMLRSSKRGLSNKNIGSNRQQRRVERAKIKRKHH